MMNARADIEYSPTEVSKASAGEIAMSRACFEELKVQGCGDPGEETDHFRTCLKDVYQSLTGSCQRMMSELYGKQ